MWVTIINVNVGTIINFSVGTASKSNKELLAIINKNFDLRPGMIIKLVLPFSFLVASSLLPFRSLGLRSPIYQKSACYGHFGRDEFPWEQPKKLDI